MDRILDEHGVSHARWPLSPWMVCGLFVADGDIPLPDGAEVTCPRCLKKLSTTTQIRMGVS